MEITRSISDGKIMSYRSEGHANRSRIFGSEYTGKNGVKTSEQVQLLLESMVVMLNTIQESYNEFLTPNKLYKRR
ncbi:hypothetical protein ABLO26_08570 [Neobacillus sp. 179-J 1A1 HS]